MGSNCSLQQITYCQKCINQWQWAYPPSLRVYFQLASSMDLLNRRHHSKWGRSRCEYCQYYSRAPYADAWNVQRHIYTHLNSVHWLYGAYDSLEVSPCGQHTFQWALPSWRWVLSKKLCSQRSEEISSTAWKVYMLYFLFRPWQLKRFKDTHVCRNLLEINSYPETDIGWII